MSAFSSKFDTSKARLFSTAAIYDRVNFMTDFNGKTFGTAQVDGQRGIE
ncbi:MAG: hypothetical protein SR1Q7_10930 [Quinella sp. 1Q7]|nr:hypothetical protein [Quinella sp. 1Q7]